MGRAAPTLVWEGGTCPTSETHPGPHFGTRSQQSLGAQGVHLLALLFLCVGGGGGGSADARCKARIPAQPLRTGVEARETVTYVQFEEICQPHQHRDVRDEVSMKAQFLQPCEWSAEVRSNGGVAAKSALARQGAEGTQLVGRVRGPLQQEG